MRIGLSYSRCIRDIIEGKVDIKDVLIIIARTDFDPHDDKQWEDIWRGYGGGQTVGSAWSMPEWGEYSDEDEDRFRSVSIDLWEQGKIHQPRKFGAKPPRLQYYWLEVGLPSDEIEDNPTLKKAWEQFQIVAGLTSNKNKDYNNDF